MQMYYYFPLIAILFSTKKGNPIGFPLTVSIIHVTSHRQLQLQQG
jgi:hypothetical protein